MRFSKIAVPTAAFLAAAAVFALGRIPAQADGKPDGDAPGKIGEAIFNGTDLTGWIPVKSGEFKVLDGAIAVTGKGGSGWLRTEKTWRDFTLTFERSRPANGTR